jgi:hypothetical protein
MPGKLSALVIGQVLELGVREADHSVGGNDEDGGGHSAPVGFGGHSRDTPAALPDLLLDRRAVRLYSMGTAVVTMVV